MVEIPLTRGLVALIDDADLELVGRFNWHAKPAGRTHYAYRTYKGDTGRRICQAMHQLICGYGITDHVNGDGLDNRRGNLRSVDQAQNNCNARKRTGSSSIFKGVKRVPLSRESWAARIKVNGEERHIGSFGTEADAALAYDAAARSLFGEYAALNFPGPGERCALTVPIVLTGPIEPQGRRVATADRTHCPKGHPYDQENTYRDPRGRRGCRACNRQSAREYTQRKRRVTS